MPDYLKMVQVRKLPLAVLKKAGSAGPPPSPGRGELCQTLVLNFRTSPVAKQSTSAFPLPLDVGSPTGNPQHR